MNKIVLHKGPSPADVMVIGEKPGRMEASIGMPFVGPTGREQRAMLRDGGILERDCYMTNLSKEYVEGNPDPTSEEISKWSPVLESEILTVGPRVIFAVGRYAMKWFLGDDISMRMVHGLAYIGNEFRVDRWSRAGGAIVVPVYHPAAGMHDGGMRALVVQDYQRACKVVYDYNRDNRYRIPVDEYEGRENYVDCADLEIRDYLDLRGHIDFLALDTEGVKDSPWSIQVSHAPGTAYVLRRTHDRFNEYVNVLNDRIRKDNTTIIMHNRSWDIDMCDEMGLELDLSQDVPFVDYIEMTRDEEQRYTMEPGITLESCLQMGLNLSGCKILDTQYMAYLLRREAQSLKVLAYRRCRAMQRTYKETIGSIGLQKQLTWLDQIAKSNIKAIAPRQITKNDGSSKNWKPWSIARYANGIIKDVESGKLDKDDNPTDPVKRWGKISPLVKQSAAVYGDMPVGTLADLPLDEAVYYAGRDPDLALRVATQLLPEIAEKGLGKLLDDGMRVAPMFECMQRNGMDVSRKYFDRLSQKLSGEMHEIRSELINKHNDGQPFNPKSYKHVGSLLDRRGLEALKKTKGGAPSTSQKSIGYLCYDDDSTGRRADPAVKLVFHYRERQHLRDSFCAPILDRTAIDGDDIQTVHCQIMTTRTATRRPATKNPNLLAIPVRSGPIIRDGYVCRPGEAFVACDFSQIEVRVMAHLSGDELLCQLFNEGRDVYSELAAKIFGVELSNVDEMLQRRPAKVAFLGIMYGLGGLGLSDQLKMLGLSGWGEIGSANLIMDILNVHPQVWDYMQRVKIETLHAVDNVVRDHWGMPRFLPGIKSFDKATRAEAGRHAVSHRVQGMAQGMVQKAMIWLWPRISAMINAGLNVKPRLEVHDEILVTCDDGLSTTIGDMLIEAMTEHCGVRLNVPIEAEVSVATTWGGLKE